MINHSTPSAWSRQLLSGARCLPHVLGLPVCLDGTCTYRHGDANEKALPGLLGWFSNLESEEEM